MVTVCFCDIIQVSLVYCPWTLHGVENIQIQTKILFKPTATMYFLPVWDPDLTLEIFLHRGCI